jgi:hypothetical protein
LFRFEISKYCSRTYNHSASADAKLSQPVAKLPQLPIQLPHVLGKKGEKFSLAAVEIGMEIMSHGMSAQTARLLNLKKERRERRKIIIPPALTLDC